MGATRHDAHDDGHQHHNRFSKHHQHDTHDVPKDAEHAPGVDAEPPPPHADVQAHAFLLHRGNCMVRNRIFGFDISNVPYVN